MNSRLALVAVILISAASPLSAAERWPHSDAAVTAFNKGDYVAARFELEESLARCEESSPRADECLQLLMELANVAGTLDPAAGEFYARQALALAQRTLPGNSPEIATAFNNVGAILVRQRRYAEAETVFRQVVELREAALPTGDPAIATALNNLAVVLEVLGRDGEAELIYRRVLAMREKSLPRGHELIAQSLHSLAGFLDKHGRDREAQDLYSGALDVMKGTLPSSHPDRINVEWRFGVFLLDRMGEPAKARVQFHSAGQAALERMMSHVGFTAQAEQELRSVRPIFLREVYAAWREAHGGGH